MRTLAIECATEACSVALLIDDEVMAATHRVLGRGHAEHLVPMIAALPDRGRAHEILVSLGPGSFTGVRIGIATAKALGLAWRAHVRGYPTLALLAAMALEEHRAGGVTVVMTGGHGEWFVQDFANDGLPASPLQSLSPQAALKRDLGWPLAGSQARQLGELRGSGKAPQVILPDASRVGLLDPSLLTAEVAPIYGRGPDARLPT
jgi:tRNA threonylcarbamoyl adenosine modification protein YeaZ